MNYNAYCTPDTDSRFEDGSGNLHNIDHHNACCTPDTDFCSKTGQ